jgi:hypothetical protein
MTARAPRGVVRRALVPFLALLAGAAIAVALLRRLRPGAFARRPLTPDQVRAVRMWRAAKVTLRRAGIEVLPSTTPGELARRLPAVAALAIPYARARWGSAPLSAADARSVLGRLRASLLQPAGARDI